MTKFAPDIKYLEPEEVEAIIGAADTARDKAMLAIMYICGLRRAEVQFLIRDDYNAARGLLRVTRLKKRDSYWHEIPLWTRAKTLLNEYLKTRTDHHDALFLGRKAGQALAPQGVYYVFLQAAKKAGVRIRDRADGRGNRHPSPHRLRHSIAVHQMNCGIDIADIQEHLAHAKIDTTMIYARVLTPRKKRNAMLMQSSHHFAKM